MNRLSGFNIVSLTLGFAFLYIPMVILVVYSFNESKLVTVWAGFSTKWYGEPLPPMTPIMVLLALIGFHPSFCSDPSQPVPDCNQTARSIRPRSRNSMPSGSIRTR